MNLAEWLVRAGKSDPHRPAIGYGTRVVRSYGEFAERAARLAAAMRNRYGLAPGDRVMIAAKNSADYLEILYAIWHAGLVAVPANAKLHGGELGYIPAPGSASARRASTVSLRRTCRHTLLNRSRLAVRNTNSF
jgi:long-chain acyl-CoA synthetase